MNARQQKKRLKKQIDKLQLDNDLMRRIIVDSPTMQELYDLYNKPLFVTHTAMQFQEYRSRRFLAPDRPYDAGIIALLKQEVTEDLLDALKYHIDYKLDTECISPNITASIFVGIKGGTRNECAF